MRAFIRDLLGRLCNEAVDVTRELCIRPTKIGMVPQGISLDVIAKQRTPKMRTFNATRQYGDLAAGSFFVAAGPCRPVDGALELEWVVGRFLMFDLTKGALILFVFALVAGCTSIERLALPDAVTLDAYWQRYDPRSTNSIDHSAWQDFLDRYVTADLLGIHRVDYGAVSEAHRMALNRYLSALQEVSISNFNRAEQLAFWINLYNAKTVAVVLDHYPVESIRDIKLGDGLIIVGPWSSPILRVAGRPLSLNDIEHGILRPIWRDQRIHYVLNCAAVGCPNLGQSAYQGVSVGNAMDSAARAYVNDRRGIWFDKNGNLVASKIYAWFREDFGRNEDEVLRSIEAYAAPDLKARLRDRHTIQTYFYDWSLNDTRNAGSLFSAEGARSTQPSDVRHGPRAAAPSSSSWVANGARP